MRGKTIQVFLTDGTPRGIKVADITSNIEQAIFIPRKRINEASERKEVNRPGIYFLFGESDESSKPIAYIGQSRNCLKRIKSHDQKKDFWNYAVLIISKTESFTQAHIEYLEQLAIQKAIEANWFNLTNGVSPNRIEVPETLEADLLDNFDTIKILLSTLGFTIFESTKKEVKSQNIFHCKGKKANGEGEYQEDGFVVYKGSKANIKLTQTTGNSIKVLREKLLKDGILEKDGEFLMFKENYPFSSPSAAAAQLLGRNVNGWQKWKDKSGRTLDEIKRK